MAKHIRKIKLSQKPVRKPVKLPWPRSADDGTPLGVDVVEKRTDIIKIIYKFFKVPGITMEELLQEVFLAIIHKNYTRSAHDPRKSSFGHYVYMVGRNVCINLVHQKKRFEREKESLDAPSKYDNSRTLLDTIDIPIELEDDRFHDFMMEMEAIFRKQGLWDIARYIRAVRSGAPSDIIREAMSWGGRKVTTKTIRDIRNQVKDYSATVCDMVALN